MSRRSRTTRVASRRHGEPSVTGNWAIPVTPARRVPWPAASPGWARASSLAYPIQCARSPSHQPGAVMRPTRRTRPPQHCLFIRNPQRSSNMDFLRRVRPCLFALALMLLLAGCATDAVTAVNPQIPAATSTGSVPFGSQRPIRLSSRMPTRGGRRKTSRSISMPAPRLASLSSSSLSPQRTMRR